MKNRYVYVILTYKYHASCIHADTKNVVLVRPCNGVKDTWTLPGGKLEMGMSPLEGAKSFLKKQKVEYDTTDLVEIPNESENVHVFTAAIKAACVCHPEEHRGQPCRHRGFSLKELKDGDFQEVMWNRHILKNLVTEIVIEGHEICPYMKPILATWVAPHP